MKTVWLEECGKGDPNLKRIGVLNKSDLLPGGKSEGERFADTLRELSDKPFHSVHVVSALNGDGIDELFADIAQTALESTLRDSTEEIKSVVDIAEHPTRRCC
jgi:predicted GTPase